MITKERAKQILNMHQYGSIPKAFVGRFGVSSADNALFSREGVSESEDAYVRSLWNKLPGYYSYSDTLRYIANGRDVKKGRS